MSDRVWNLEIVTRYTLLFLLALLFVGGLVRLLATGSFWYDEATLFVNIRDASWVAMTRPLPFYDQAAPLGYLALEKAIYTVGGLNEKLLRAPSFISWITISLLAISLKSIEIKERILFAIAICSSSVVIDYGVQAKHYIVDLAFMMAVLVVFLRQDTAVSTRIFVTIFGIVFSMQTPVALSAVVVAGAAEAIFNKERASGRQRFGRWMAFIRGNWYIAALILVNLIYYILVVQPASSLQIKLYRYTFDFGFPADDIIRFYIDFVLYFMRSHGSLGLWLIFIPVMCLGVFDGLRRNRTTAVAFLAIPTIVVALNLVRVYPLVAGRFSLVLLPTVTFFLALGAVGLARRIPGRWGSPVTVVLFGTVLACLAGAGAVAWPRRDMRDVQPVFDELERHLQSGQTILLTIGSQPIYDAYFGPVPPMPGRCLEASEQIIGWTSRCSHEGAPDRPTGFVGMATPWRVMNYIAHSSLEGPVRDVPSDELLAWRRTYIQYLRMEGCAHQPTILFNVGLTRSFVMPVVSGGLSLINDPVPQELQQDAFLARLECPAVPDGPALTG